MTPRLLELSIQRDAHQYALAEPFLIELRKAFRQGEINSGEFAYLRKLAISGQKTQAQKELNEKRGVTCA